MGARAEFILRNFTFTSFHGGTVVACFYRAGSCSLLFPTNRLSRLEVSSKTSFRVTTGLESDIINVEADP